VCCMLKSREEYEMNKKTILLVDDDRDLVESNRQLLESEGYMVYTAFDGKSGIEKAKEVKPDLMLLDVMMAHSTEGFDISREIPKIPELKRTPVVMLTGIRQKMHLPFGFQPDGTWLPVKAVLEKPVLPEKLMEVIRQYAG